VSALAFTDGTVRQLDRATEADARVTAADVQDPETLARMLQELRKDVARLRGQWTPRSVTFVDVVTTGSGGTPQTLRFPHGFGGRVWYSVVSSSGAAMRLDYSSASSTNDVLILSSYSAGTFSLRIEEMG